ncbi:hypothetical protein D3C81_2203440 [compost metagenome]
MYSFQAWRKANSPDTPRPGVSNGRIITKKLRVKLEPSIMAASSSSLGMDFRKLSRMKKVLAWALTRISTTPHNVLFR